MQSGFGVTTVDTDMEPPHRKQRVGVHFTPIYLFDEDLRFPWTYL